MPRVTVILPTHDHADLLRFSIGSVLNQTIGDFELFVIGDGVSERTRKIIDEFSAADTRIRFFDHPKGERHGELYRHHALAEASGNLVCYLSDDDLWLPSHLEAMAGILAENDFGHARAALVDGNGEISTYRGDLSIHECRIGLLAGANFIPLSTAGHRLELYRGLPFGWRPAPKGIFSDLYMWQQIISSEPLRASSGRRVSVLNFPSSKRKGQTDQQRLDELASWASKLAQPGFERWIADEVGAYLQKEWVQSTLAHERAATALDNLHTRHSLLDTRVNVLSDRCADLQRLITSIENGVTHRLRRRALKTPLLGPLLRFGSSRLSRS